jgi:hypothetical protein
MTTARLACFVAALALPFCAAAADPSFQVVQVFSNADGTVQFVQLREVAGQNGQQGLAGKTLTVTRNGATTAVFTFPADLPSANTAAGSTLRASTSGPSERCRATGSPRCTAPAMRCATTTRRISAASP